MSMTIKPFGGFFLRRGTARWFVSETIGQIGTKQPVMLMDSPKARVAAAALRALMAHCAAVRSNDMAGALPAVQAAVSAYGFRAVHCARDMRLAERIAVMPLPTKEG